MSRSVRSVVVVSAHPQRALFDAMLVDTNDYDVVYVESIRKGYSRIRRVTPDLVVFQGIDDVAACRLLSMLKIDDALSGIPVLTCAMRREQSEFQDDIAGLNRDSPSRAPAISMN